MVTKSREEVYEDADIAHELEDFFDDEEKGLRELAEPNAEASRLVKDISDPTRLVRIYVTETGEPRNVPKWTLDGKNSILRRKQNGQREFSLRPPEGKVWEPGDVLCLLHPKHPRRAEFDKMGLRGKTCAPLFPFKHAGSLASEFALEIHMQHRHSQEWATIQRAEAKIREEEYRDFQRVQAQAARIAVEGATTKPAKAGA